MKSLIYFCLGVTFASVIWSCVCAYKLQGYKAYYNATERVLERTCEVYDSFFDTVGETDDYYYHLEAREKIAQ